MFKPTPPTYDELAAELRRVTTMLEQAQDRAFLDPMNIVEMFGIRERKLFATIADLEARSGLTRTKF